MMLFAGISMYSQASSIEVDLIVTLIPMHNGDGRFQVYLDNGEEIRKAPPTFESIVKVIKIYEKQGYLLTQITESDSIRLYFREKVLE